MFRRRPVPVPEALAFLSPTEWSRFAKRVDRIVDIRGWERRAADVRTDRDTMIHLRDLARLCRDLDETSWDGEIRKHFDQRSGDDEPLEDRLATDDAVALSRLRARPYSSDEVDASPMPIVHRPLAGGVVELLCFDLPESVAIVTEERAAQLGGSVDALYAAALGNVRADGPPASGGLVDLGEGVSAHTFGGSFYATAWSRWVDELVPGVGPAGALVAMPFGQGLAVVPLDAPTALVAPGRLLRHAAAGFSDRANPISPELFWWRGGALTHLPGGRDDETVRFTPSDDYLEAVEALR